MRPRISNRELRLLSLYLDKQLSPVEQQRLEKRLRESPSLQQTLEELKETRRLLRAMPKARAPRSFALTPQMVGYRPLRPAFRVSGFVSAMASFLFLLVLAVDLLGVLNRSSKSVAFQESPQYEAAAPALENAQEKSMQAEQVTLATMPEETQEAMIEAFQAVEPASALTAAPPATRAAQNQGIEDTTALPQAESFAKEAPAPSLGMTDDSSAVGGAVTSTVILEMELLPMETPTGQVVTGTPPSLPAASAREAPSTPSATAQIAAISEGSAITGETSEDMNQERILTGDEEAVNQERKSPVESPGRWIVWIVEGALALIALISGAVFLRRRGSLIR